MESQLFLLSCDCGDIEQAQKHLSETAVAKRWKSTDSRKYGKFFNIGVTPLMMASRSGHSEIVQMLLKAGAEVNDTDDEDWNSLHYACFSGHAGIAKILLQSNCDDSLITKYERATPLQFAVHRKFGDTVAVFGGEQPPEYNDFTRKSVIQKGMMKLAKERPSSDSSYTLLHRYKMSLESYVVWKQYLESEARSSVSLPAVDLAVGKPVWVFMYPQLPRPSSSQVQGTIIRHSSVSGLQNFTISLRESHEDSS